MKKVTISLTSAQQDQIRNETGEDVKSFTYEALEGRDAPKIAGGGLDDGSLSRGGGKPSRA
jgi:hypothetical protein